MRLEFDLLPLRRVERLSVDIGLLVEVNRQVFNMVSNKSICLILDLVSFSSNCSQIVLHLDQFVTKLFTIVLLTIKNG